MRLPTLPDLSEPDSPPVLLLGPEGSGKRTAALKEAGQLANLADVLVLDKFKRSDADTLAEFVSVHPVSGYKVAVIDVSRATSQALETLLRITEEPPRYLRVILYASERVTETLRSRCSVVWFEPLRTDSVASALESEALPSADAAAARGNMKVARRLAEADARNSTVSVIEAVVSRDLMKLTTALSKALGHKAKKEAVADLLLAAILQSFASESHKLASVPYDARVQAAGMLTTPSPAELRVRRAALRMAT